MGGGDRVSVLGQPQGDWDDFLEDARKPKKRWRLSRILLVVAAVAVAAAVLIYYYYQGS
jgi:flagellar basal body-associated protein FliL